LPVPLQKVIMSIAKPTVRPVSLPRTMSHDDKIYVDAKQPATLNDGARRLTDYRTLEEAVMAWHRLPPEQTKRATIKVFDGPVYTAAEIVCLHYGPRPA
jgi:hypothetical protein